MRSAKPIIEFLKSVQGRSERTALDLAALTLSGRYIQIFSEEDGWSDPAVVGANIWESAKNYTEATEGGMQRFMIRAYDATTEDYQKRHENGGDLKVMQTMPFVQQKALTTSDSERSLSSEPATSEGLLAQLMRHNEETQRLLNGTLGVMQHTMTRSIESLRAQNEKLLADRGSALEMLEGLFQQKHEREMEIKEQETRAENMKALFAKISQYFPHIVNKLSGKEIVPQKHSSFEMASYEFLSSLSEEQLDQLADSGIIKPDQKLLIGTLMEQSMKTFTTKEAKEEQSSEVKKMVFGQTPDEPKNELEKNTTQE